jgi:hypothetical protein
MFHYRWAVYASIRHRLTRVRGNTGSEHLGRLAERHALEGLDPQRLATSLRLAGLEIVQIELQPGGRYRPIRGAFRVLRRASTFSIVAQRKEQLAT